MTPEELQAWSTLAGTLGGNAFLFLGVIGLIKGWVITKAHHDEVVAQLEARIEKLKSSPYAGD